MTSTGRVGRLIGVLLLVHLVMGLILPYVLLRPLTTVPAGFLDTAAGMPVLVRLNVLVLFVGGALPVAIITAGWPVFRPGNPALALWLLVLAAVNLSLQVVENAHWLSMLSVSQAYAQAGAADAGTYQSIGIAVRSAWKWAHYSHIFVVVGWIFLFYALLFRATLVPRALAAAGLVTAVLQFTGITLPEFLGYRMPRPEFFGMPLGLANLVLGSWLIVKGLDSPARQADGHRIDV